MVQSESGRPFVAVYFQANYLNALLRFLGRLFSHPIHWLEFLNENFVFRISAKYSKCQKKFCEMSESDKRTKMVSLQFITVIMVRMNSEFIGGIN